MLPQWVEFTRKNFLLVTYIRMFRRNDLLIYIIIIGPSRVDVIATSIVAINGRHFSRHIINHIPACDHQVIFLTLVQNPKRYPQINTNCNVTCDIYIYIYGGVIHYKSSHIVTCLAQKLLVRTYSSIFRISRLIFR